MIAMNNDTFDVPVLLIGFNRASSFRRVLDAIRCIKPSQLYVAIDGPRSSVKSDYDEVSEVKKIIEKIDWECDLHKLYRNHNVGCGRGPAEAITWAFESCNELIILEDDCVPTKSFFIFCEEMLLRYKDDTRVWLVSGDNYCCIDDFFQDKDYLFSHYAHTHGWATWKRCWSQFDMRMSDFDEFLKIGGAYNVLKYKEAAKVFNRKYSLIYNNIENEIKHSWDSQWGYTRLKNNGLGIVPKRHLVQNIGVFGTHFNGNTAVTEQESDELSWPLKHPTFIIAEEQYEKKYYKKYLRDLYPPLWYRVMRRIKILIGLA